MLFSASVSRAELSIEDTRNLLQESLTISEIDREVARISAEEITVEQKINETQHNIEYQNTKVSEAKVHAGKVLRAYYTGDRDKIWMLLLRADSFSDALSVYQYLQSIADADQRAMKRFLASFRELKQLKQELEDRKTNLGELKAAFIAQRERVILLQRQLDDKLAKVDNADQLRLQMAQLTEAWRKEGLPVFKTYLQAMSDAMIQLPDYLKENADALEPKGRKSILFHIQEKPLNAFLRKQDELFERFVFTMTDQYITINGTQGKVNITINGHYAIEKEPEEALRFILDELIYNGFALPDTTRADMQKQFSMSFFPKQNSLTASMEVNNVLLKKGQLTIEFSLVQ